MSSVERAAAALTELRGPMTELLRVGQDLGTRLRDAGARKDLGLEVINVALQQGVDYLSTRAGTARADGPGAIPVQPDGGEPNGISEVENSRPGAVEYVQAAPPRAVTAGLGVDALAGVGQVVSMVAGIAQAANPAAVGLAAGGMVINATAETVQAVAVDMAQTLGAAKTAQTRILARRDVMVAQIEATTSIISQYLDLTFDERRENFKRLFDALDRAQETGNLQEMQLTLGAILELVKTSPFKSLEDFKNKLADPDFEFEI
ncbi:MAG TPA: hypothetical protein VHN99_02165 [Deinococcales bacterium]|nr:hypothetical protein [Deinococcales bacterium]